MQPRSLTLLRAAVVLCVIGLVAGCSTPGSTAAPTTAGNATTAWAELGRPPSPTGRELDWLREAAQPARSHHRRA